ncbi:MAG TPA: hypothetical protein VMU01_08675 [Rhizomicrobium sp.]|nr:hypothetical protein [Rhizomicrobium sp.]
MTTRFVVAALLGGMLLVPPAAAEPPAVFVATMFGSYKTMDQWARNYDPCKEFCTEDFDKLLKAARAKKLIDYDPICQCQKGGDNYMMFSGSQGATDSDYRATVKKVGKPGMWVLDLQWVNGGWLIRDVVETRNGKPVSLRQRLAAAGA